MRVGGGVLPATNYGYLTVKLILDLGQQESEMIIGKAYSIPCGWTHIHHKVKHPPFKHKEMRI